MRPVRAVAVVAVAALLGLLVWDVAHQQNKGIAAKVDHGQSVAAPALDLPRLGGGPNFDLAANRGKVVVVNFWASDCAPCKEEMPRLVSFAGTWSGRGVVVVGVDVDELAKGPAQAFAHRYGATYPMVFDPTGSTVDPWGVGEGTPQTFFVDRRGRIVDHVLGPVSTAALAAGAQRALRS